MKNVSNAIAEGFRKRGVDVTTTPEVGLISASNEAQLEFALSQKRVIFTQDTDFLKLNTLGETYFGIVFYPQQTKSIGQIIQGLILIWELLKSEEIFGKIEYL